MKSARANTLLVFISTAIALVLANAIYAVFFEPMEEKLPILGHGYPALIYDPVFGLVNNPNTDTLFEIPEFKHRVVINNEGMRYHDIGPKKGFRVAMIGDSFAFGHGVEAEERFGDIIEQSLGVDMLNFSASGYGPVQYYLWSDKVITFKPDLVVLAMCPSNDLSDSTINNHRNIFRPYAVLKKDEAVIQGIPVPDVREYAIPFYGIRKYALGRLLYGHLAPWLPASWKIERMPASHGMKKFSRKLIYKKPTDSSAQKAVKITEKMIIAIRDKFAAQGIPVLIFVTMTHRDLENANGLKALAGIAKRQNIPLIKSHTSCGKECFYPLDEHWTPLGHRKAAESLLPVIKRYEAKWEAGTLEKPAYTVEKPLKIFKYKGPAKPQ